jgi:hypothetical protein
LIEKDNRKTLGKLLDLPGTVGKHTGNQQQKRKIILIERKEQDNEVRKQT